MLSPPAVSRPRNSIVWTPAVTVNVPVASDWARPVLLMVATEGVAEAQVTRLVKSAVEPSA